MLDKHFIAPFRVYIKWILVMASLLPFNSLGLYKQHASTANPRLCVMTAEGRNRHVSLE